MKAGDAQPGLHREPAGTEASVLSFEQNNCAFVYWPKTGRELSGGVVSWCPVSNGVVEESYACLLLNSLGIEIPALLAHARC